MRFIVHKATIPPDERDIFEQFGVNVIGSVLAAGHAPGAPELVDVYNRGTPLQGHALQWMTEQFHLAERKETWSLLMEIVITIFVVVETVTSLVSYFRPPHHP